MPNVEITLNVGRSHEKKEELAKVISRAFEDLGVCSAEVVSIIYRDVELHDWVIGGLSMSKRHSEIAQKERSGS